MTRPVFDDAVDECLKRDSRFAREAYFFVREALDHSRNSLREESHSRDTTHVTGAQLCDGLRRLALDQFGPLSRMVLESWGVRTTHDIGEIVFLLIESRAFSRSDDDVLEHFDDQFDFEEAFEVPFRPRDMPEPSPESPSGAVSGPPTP